jgi:hypothetical protein
VRAFFCPSTESLNLLFIALLATRSLRTLVQNTSQVASPLSQSLESLLVPQKKKKTITTGVRPEHDLGCTFQLEASKTLLC